MSTNAVRLHRVLRATPESVYRAFLDPDAMAKWLPPQRLHRQGPPPGCPGRRQLQDVVHELHDAATAIPSAASTSNSCPHERIRYTDKFDDPNLPGEMQTTVTLREVSCGTELSVVQEGIPEVIPLEACYLGWQESLTLLAKLVEPEITE